jgi:hypothetical protein
MSNKTNKIDELEQLASKALTGFESLELFKQKVLALKSGIPRPSAKRYPHFNELLDILTTPP